MKVLVTGANRGLGFELCRTLQVERGASVIAVCRQSSPDLEQLRPYKIVSGIDVQHAGSVNHLKDEIAGEKIDVLVNNAGLFSPEEEAQTLDQIAGNLDASILMFEKAYQINTLGPLRMTAVLLDQLNPGAKVVMISSHLASCADNRAGKFYGFRSSKAGGNAIAVSMAQDLKPKGIAVCMINPGPVDMEMAQDVQKGSAAHAASSVVDRIQELSLETTGSFLDAASGRPLPF